MIYSAIITLIVAWSGLNKLVLFFYENDTKWVDAKTTANVPLEEKSEFTLGYVFLFLQVTLTLTLLFARRSIY